ncbi:MAG: hypothetical protein KME04_17985 [Pleurocapsa minor GSE-CHR-MK-17-07R]|jgi:uncharacterized protein YkwD|nr:hypothetical protein [Pleurocapsa minor GSE-CHR-MK 17-07R]
MRFRTTIMMMAGLLMLALLLASGALLAQDAPDAIVSQPTPTPELLPPDIDLMREVYTRLNNHRLRIGLHPYRWNAALSIAAQEQAEYLVGRRVRLHFRADGSSPSQRAIAAGFPPAGWCCGENFYRSTDVTPSFAVSWWLGSINHVGNMVNRTFTDVGVGMSSDGYTTAYVLVFGEMADPNQDG